jgi:lysozyme family protein
MKENYTRCLHHTLKYEGGYVNHPKDPGGATNRGVTQAVYDQWRKAHGHPHQSVKAITEEEVQGIYRKQYWDKVRGDDLPVGVDMAVFDFAVNSGVSRAIKYLQGVVGVAQDGAMGPGTLAAVEAKEAAGFDVAGAVTNKRLAFMKGLNTWPTFGKGWSARIADIGKVTVAMRADTKTRMA